MGKHMQSDTEGQNVIFDEQRESHGWILLMRKFRSLGLDEAADRLEQALDTSRLLSKPESR